MAIYKFRQYQVVGRALPTETEEHPKIYRMKLWGTNGVRANSKFWDASVVFVSAGLEIAIFFRRRYFLRKLKKVKKSNGQILAINEIFEKNPTTIKNYGIWLRYQSRTGYHNMYKEYRDTTLNGAVEQMYTEMASRHRVRHHCIQIIKTATIPAKLCKRESTKQFHDSKIKFPLVFRKVRPPTRKLKTTYKASRPNLFMLADFEQQHRLLVTSWMPSCLFLRSQFPGIERRHLTFSVSGFSSFFQGSIPRESGIRVSPGLLSLKLGVMVGLVIFPGQLPSSLVLAYQSFGVVYGDLSTSPLYVYSSTFNRQLENHQNADAVLGVFSLIFWTLTLIPLLKYVSIILSADDNGEGGTFALYSLLCRHVKFGLLPNQQSADEELSSYKYGPLRQSSLSLALRRYLEKRKKSRTALLLVVLLGAGMVIGDGAISPAMSVLSSLSGLTSTNTRLANGAIMSLACIILVALFALQHFGTKRVGFLFAPVVVLCRIVCGSLGTEAMFADLGHFTACSIRIAFVFLVYPCLVVQYMGQAAYLSKNISAIPIGFYATIPDAVIWPVFIIATLAAIVASQAIISATFSIVKQCQGLGCFPRVKIVHSKQIHGRVYIPEINWMLMILTLTVAVGFHDTNKIGNAYGYKKLLDIRFQCLLWKLTIVLIEITFRILVVLYMSVLDKIGIVMVGYVEMLGLAVLSVMLITTFLMALVMVFVWQRSVALAVVFFLFFWFIEGPSLGIVRVPGIGLIYSELATGVPPIFSHFVTNLPAFHNVLVFVCLKFVPVPHVSPAERFLIGRICPRPYRMYRCIARYGYKDLLGDDENFENLLIQSIAEFIQMEAVGLVTSPEMAYDGRMAVISSRTIQSTTSLTVTEEDEDGARPPIPTSKSSTLHSLRMSYEEENPQLRRRQLRFQIPQFPAMDPAVAEELTDLIQAKEAGVAYIMGHSYVKARRSSSFLKKLIIDFGYSFLRKNCRASAVGLHIPQISLIEVGMVYYV
ncbi:Potassium transporter 4 [Sesamum angolense]|uniref:Potassium transporter 4 n=2 Tax=Magnoliopsida TaxID=3398 RepID=A0AAE1W707_9LAMI|nr:Potassium transporter 4 [Sesamum angolense]